MESQPQNPEFRINPENFHQYSTVHRWSYISADVLLNLVNELLKSDKMLGLPSILSLFRNEFNKLKKKSIIEEHEC